MIAPYQQLSSMQGNPLLARNIDETVNNLKNLEICIDQLRNDLVNVAESTGNLPAVQRLRTPASLAAASPAAAAGAWSPFDIQRQLASPLAQSAASPYGPHDPYETAMNPYSASLAGASLANPAAASPYAASVSPAASTLAPWQAQQAQLQQIRLAELARQGAVSPFSQAAVHPNQAAVSPFSQAAVSPFSQAAVHPNQAAISPFSQAAVSPFSQAAVNPFSQMAISPYSQAAVHPSQTAISPFSQAAVQQQNLAQRVPNTISQSPYAATPNLATRQLGAQQITPGAVGPF